jgi:hypothetical protein
MFFKRVLAVFVLLFFVFYLISQPESAAHLVRTIFEVIGIAFQALVRFFHAL